MTTYTQTEQALQIETVLGPDALLLAQIEGEEAISRPFRFELELASPRMDVDSAALLRTPAAVSFPLHDGSRRAIHGLFSRFAQTGRHEDLATYRAELVAWPWFLSFRRTRRVFQEKSILEIAEDIFRSWGFTDFEFRCEERPAQDYVVQYNESDLDFVSRWLEAEGIFYYFEHSPDAHVMVLADSNRAIEPCPGIAEAWFRSQPIIDMDVITSLTREHAVQVGRVTLRDYDYLQPSLSLEASLEGDGLGEIYDYPGSFSTPEDADRYARYRLEAEEVHKEQVRGDGNCRWMVSGHSFQLRGHFNPKTDGEYIITAVKHQASTAGFRTGESDELDYRNAFQCSRADVPYRPRRIHERPVLQGTQTAVVVGPAGEEIWTDRMGRVKVQFHWDRDGGRDEDSSCWVRVASPWRSKGFGSINIPRIGDEVVVDFVEGDPDRPIVTGSVHNANRMPPYDLPDNQTRSGTKSRSSKGGGTTNYNEIRIEDKTGAEELLLHAEKQFTLEVEADEDHSVGGNQSLRVDGDRTVHVKGSFTEKVDAGEKRTIKGGIEETVFGDVKQVINGVVDQTVTGGVRVTTPADCEINTGGRCKITAPNGVQCIAPGGQTHVDSFWDQTGGTQNTSFGRRFQLSGHVVQVFGARFTARGVDTRVTGFKNDTVGILMEQRGVELSRKAVHFGSAGVHFLAAGLVSIL